jgi:glucose-6-phosphate isomerase, archaeal
MQTSGEISLDFATGLLKGASIVETTRTIADLKQVFRDEQARKAMDESQVVYRVQAFLPVAEGIEGGLFWGTTFLQPGCVGDEYFMTKGHFHEKRDRGEYYVTILGTGMLILMSEDRVTQTQRMTPGSTHYIPGYTAHRVSNIGAQTLSFLACWPSDAGHDYETIARNGFTARVRRVNGQPKLVAEL